MSDNLFKVLKGDYFESYPPDVQESSDPDFRGLANKINQLRNELVNRFQGRDLDLTIEDLSTIYIPEQSPFKTLEQLAYMASYDFDRSKPIRELRINIFKRIKLNKKTGTVDFLIDRVAEVTGVTPEFILPNNMSYIGWDQDNTIDGNPENINFFGGIKWDQLADPTIEIFKWFVKPDLIFLDIKNNGVFDADAARNARILAKVYATAARHKDAPIPIKVGFIDAFTGGQITMMYVFSRDVIHPTDTPPTGSINNKDMGIEF